MRATKVTKGYRRIVPSLTALVEFEAVARLSSFTLAATELGVTQAAVSRQVRFLEETLNVRLFHRMHRSIALTKEGQALYLVVAESMQKIAGVFDRLSTGAEQQELVLASTAPFAQFRLMPRLPNLKRLDPPLQLRLTTQMFTADLRHVEVDVAVRYGDGKWGDGTSTLLFDEEVFPVCSPAFLAENKAPESLQDLAKLPLIDADSTYEGWMAWEGWFRSVGYRPAKLNYVLRCSLYTDAVQAARYGQGVALGWSRMVHDLLAKGELVRLTDASSKPTDAYFVIVPHGRSITPVVGRLIDWLREDVAIR
ncbi:LysR substrate-binding domain-containing protein [Cupriavidus consociatus]|uniref:LysR substrate-binding domain-containing protein n=1 Tax=Cupriavidus consociatus TaxID=2821357 RepID=UPI001AE4CD69|nr:MULTISPECIES: LysR substrate-binding domain-containing protein [unclassified Cupriavidus]MBP0619224.1 LysR family transcriptional regulator [Cupriavidus sp. LEh25]MDK2655870.1 LysR substrate-binding domain-containing protein [Cupriavidus sp. LEh21]